MNRLDDIERWWLVEDPDGHITIRASDGRALLAVARAAYQVSFSGIESNPSPPGVEWYTVQVDRDDWHALVDALRPLTEEES